MGSRRINTPETQLCFIVFPSVAHTSLDVSAQLTRCHLAAASPGAAPGPQAPAAGLKQPSMERGVAQSSRLAGGGSRGVRQTAVRWGGCTKITLQTDPLLKQTPRTVM